MKENSNREETKKNNNQPELNSVERLMQETGEPSTKVELPELNRGLKWQIENYLLSVNAVELKRGKKIDREQRTRELAMTYYKLYQFIYSRDQRVEDIKSPEVQEAISIKKSMFPFGIPKLNICIDGRVLAKSIAGLHGNALRTPAGDNPIEFLPKKNGSGLFLKEGEFTAIIDQAFKDSDNIFEVLDSHLACAAGELHSHKRTGENPADHGLYDDVVRKKQMAAAMQEYAKKNMARKKIFQLFKFRLIRTMVFVLSA